MNRGSEETGYVASHEQQTKIIRTIPALTVTVHWGKTTQVKKVTCITQDDLCMSLLDCLKMHTNMKTKENIRKEQTLRKNEIRNKTGRN